MVKAVLLNDTRVDRHHGCTSVIATIDELCAANNIELVTHSPAHHDWRGDEQLLRAVEVADCIIVNGEGTIHHDRPAGKTLLEAGRYAKERGKHAFLINATWQSNSDASLRMLESFDLVSIRESASEQELRGFGFDPRRVPDLALYHQPRTSLLRSGVGYSDSVLGPTALALYKKMWGFDAVPIPIVQPSLQPLELARWLRRFGASWSSLLGPAHARDAARAAWQDYRYRTFDHEKFTSRIAAKDLIVTGRFHKLIFALGSMTPVLVVGSNTHKIEATLSDAGLQSWRVLRDVGKIDDRLLQKAAQWHENECENLAKFVTEGRAEIERLFFDIASKVQGA